MEEKGRYQLVEEDFAYAIVDNEEHKTYQQDCFDFGNICDLLNQQSKRIKELEETNKVLSNELTKNSILKQDHIETCCGIPIFEIPKIKEENQQLKQQLEEKEKEIATLEVMLAENKNDIQEIKEFEIGEYQYDLTDEDARYSLKCEFLHKDQDKISFAVEQLEKVKDFVNNLYGEYSASVTTNFIDNQIKELKGVNYESNK